ncbi:MAG: hypothetical protein ACR2KU_13790 [Gammaproteobacteria bacterium]
MTAWHQILRLRPDVKSETLSQEQFAADLYDVMTDRNPGVYHNPSQDRPVRFSGSLLTVTSF